MAAEPVPYRRRDGSLSYKVRFRTKPGANPVSETFSTLEAARKFARLVDRIGGTAARQQRLASDRADNDAPTLRTQLGTYLRRTAAHATPGTIAEYQRTAERTFLHRLGDMPIDELTRDDISDWVAWQRQQPTRRGGTYSPKSVSNAQRLLSSILQDAVDDDQNSLARNVAKGAKLPSDSEREEMTFLTPAELAAIFEHIPERWRPLVALLAGTGMRWGEATALTGSDFDLDAPQPVVRVRRAWKKGEAGVYLGSPKTQRGRRTITLAPATVHAVADAVRSAELDGLVFTAAEGGRIRPQNFHPRVWRPAVAASGIAKRPRVHDLRHSHIAHLIADNVPLTVIQRRVGHESIQTTNDTYGHLLPDVQVAAVAATERALAALPAGFE